LKTVIKYMDITHIVMFPYPLFYKHCGLICMRRIMQDQQNLSIATVAILKKLLIFFSVKVIVMFCL